MKKYTVWVGGTEVNDRYLDKSEAVQVSKAYELLGYDDVVIERVEK